MKSGRKVTGGKYKKPKKKKATGRANQTRTVNLEKRKTKVLKCRGNMEKLVAFSDNQINLIVKGKAKKAEIKTVIETPSNTFLARQNVLVKGAIVETEIGKAKITNRPSQEGYVQGILVE